MYRLLEMRRGMSHASVRKGKITLAPSCQNQSSRSLHRMYEVCESMPSAYYYEYMKKKLEICNRVLTMVGVIVIVSSLLLEYLHGTAFFGMDIAVWTWSHVIISTLFLCLVVWHVNLNWHGKRTWPNRFIRSKSKELKGICIFLLLTIVTGLIALPHWMVNGHAGIGGFHDKLGLIGLAFMLRHVIRHRRWYTCFRSAKAE